MATGPTTNTTTADKAAAKLARILGSEFDATITPDAVRSLIATWWPELSIYGHIIHDDLVGPQPKKETTHD